MSEYHYHPSVSRVCRLREVGRHEDGTVDLGDLETGVVVVTRCRVTDDLVVGACRAVAPELIPAPGALDSAASAVPARRPKKDNAKSKLPVSEGSD